MQFKSNGWYWISPRILPSLKLLTKYESAGRCSGKEAIIGHYYYKYDIFVSGMFALDEYFFREATDEEVVAYILEN